MTLLDDFVRVSRARPCPVCAKADWCLVSRKEADAPSRAICARTESPTRFGDAGWLHRLRDDGWRRDHRRSRTVRLSLPVRKSFDAAATAFRDALDLDALREYADSLGLTSWPLLRLGVGFADRVALRAAGIAFADGAWTVPMRDEIGQAFGVRLRLPNGVKLSLPGSRNGLFFVPSAPSSDGQLFIAEGETDTAALLDLGFTAIGRPGCRNSADLVVRFVRASKPESVVVVADNDDVGRAGALELAHRVRLHAKDVRVVAPPEGTKDARDWVKRGGQRSDVYRAVELAESVDLSISIAAWGR
jgi:phage/plasmid primase-like uncharacterized protein